MWNIKPRFGYRRIKLIIFYIYTSMDKSLRLYKFLAVTLMPITLQPIIVALNFLFPQYGQLFLSLLLLNALGMGGDMYLALLTLGCKPDSEIVDEGPSIVIRGCRADIQKRRRAAYIACFGLFYSFMTSIPGAAVLMAIAPLTGSVPPLVYVEKDGKLSITVNIPALTTILTPLFAIIGYKKQRGKKAK